MGIVQWNCKQSSSYRSNYHSCPYVHTQREFLQFLGLMLCASIIFFSPDLVPRSGNRRENLYVCLSFMDSGMGRSLCPVCIVIVVKSFVAFCVSFQSCIPFTGNLSNKVMDILAQDLLGGVRCSAMVLFKWWRCTETASQFLGVEKQGDINYRVSFLSWNTR